MSETENTTVLITGASGWLGGLVSTFTAAEHPECRARRLSTTLQLAQALYHDATLLDLRLVLVDIVEPQAPVGANAITIKADLTDSAQVDTLFQTVHGVPDTVYCLHGIMSRGSEDNFDLGIKVR